MKPDISDLGGTLERSERWERSMHTVAGGEHLVAQAAALGVTVGVDDDGRVWARPIARLPAELLATFANNREAVRLYLRQSSPAPVAVNTAHFHLPRAHATNDLLNRPEQGGSRHPRTHATNAADAGAPLAEMDAWHAGVSRLATMRCPSGIEPRRWAIYGATAARLLAQHGAALHAAGWGTLDLFGLHRHAPAYHPPGWGLVWLLNTGGELLDVAAAQVVLCVVPMGSRLVFRRRTLVPSVVPAWELLTGSVLPSETGDNSLHRPNRRL